MEDVNWIVALIKIVQSVKNVSAVIVSYCVVAIKNVKLMRYVTRIDVKPVVEVMHNVLNIWFAPVTNVSIHVKEVPRVDQMQCVVW